MAKILVLHGPNLNLLGEREPGIYGGTDLAGIEADCRALGAELGVAIDFRQSNHEGELIDAIHAARGRCAAIVINPGALTHYAWSLHDALDAFAGPVVELHLSDPKAREPWRHLSVVEPVAATTIAGQGGEGYRLAVEAAADLLGGPR